MSEGWTTDDEYRWICDACFNDFSERFKWKLRGLPQTDHIDTPWQPTIKPEGWIEK